MYWLLVTYRFFVLRICPIVLFCHASFMAHAQPFDLGTVPARGPILLPIPDVSGEIWIEIGSIDVTAFASLEDGTLHLSGFAPLESGVHTVTIYAVRGDGYDVLAEFAVSVSGTSGSGLEFSNVGSLTVTAQSDDTGDHLTADTAGEASLRTADGSVTGTVTYFGTTDKPSRPNDRLLDLQEYLIDLRQPAGAARVSARLGHHPAATGTLLIDGYSRRGLSVGLEAQETRLSFGAFVQRASDILGREDLLGLRDPDDRITGLHASWQPGAQTDLTLSLQAYEGRGTTYFSEEVGSGQGIALSLDGSARSGALRYGLTAARAGWDDDAEKGAFQTIDAGAWSGYLRYDLPGAADTAQITLGADYSVADYYFFSLANPFAAAGVARFELSAERSAANSWQRLALSTQTDAQNAPGVVPEDRLLEFSFDGQWTPPDRPDSLALTYGLNYLQQDRVKTPLAAPPAQDYRAFTGYLGLSRSTDRTAWNTQISVISEDDRTDTNADRTSLVLDMGLSHALTDAFSTDVATSITRNLLENGPDWTELDITAGFSWDIVPDRWNAALLAAANFTGEPMADDGASLILSTVYSVTDRLDMEVSAARSTGSFAGSSGPDTTFSIFFRVDLGAPRN